jgi:type VI protein secretion system component Hcp
MPRRPTKNPAPKAQAISDLPLAADEMTEVKGGFTSVEHGRAQPQLTDLVITKQVDATSPKLL